MARVAPHWHHEHAQGPRRRGGAGGGGHDNGNDNGEEDSHSDSSAVSDRRGRRRVRRGERRRVAGAGVPRLDLGASPDGSSAGSGSSSSSSTLSSDEHVHQLLLAVAPGSTNKGGGPGSGPRAGAAAGSSGAKHSRGTFMSRWKASHAAVGRMGVSTGSDTSFDMHLSAEMDTDARDLFGPADHDIIHWMWVITIDLEAAMGPGTGSGPGADGMVNVTNRDELLAALRAARCHVRCVPGTDGKTEFIKVGVCVARLFTTAERLHVQMRLSTVGLIRRWAYFVTRDVSRYWRSHDGSLFESAERVRLLRIMLESEVGVDGAGLDMTSSMRPDFILDAFALHHPSDVDHLMGAWVVPSCLGLLSQPLEDVKDYFGTEIGLYFAFLGHFTRWLAIPAVASIGVVVSQALTWYDNIAIPAYCVLLMVWVSVMLEFWKREHEALKFMWGLSTVEDEAHERAEYRGESRVGAYVAGTFIPLTGVQATITDEEARKEFTAQHTVGYYPRWRRRLTQVASSPIVVLFLALVIITTISIMILRISLIEIGLWGGGYAAGAINALAIFILNRVYYWVALRLNSWENHRTEEEFERHLVNKIFSFSFVNSYASLFYIAFAKTSNIFGKFQDECEEDDCVVDLGVQLFAIMTSRQILGAIVEFVLPWVSAQVSRLLSVCASPDSEEATNLAGVVIPIDPTPLEKEARRVALTRTLSQYAEIVIQFGYVVLFAAAFPPAAVFALLNDVVEIRADAFTLLRAFKRPIPHDTSTIQDQWFWLLQVLGLVGIITNSAIMMWTSKSLRSTLSDDPYIRLLIIVAVEHAVLALTFVVRWSIPDSPHWVTTIRLRSEFEARRALLARENEARTHARAILRQRKAKLRSKYRSRYRSARGRARRMAAAS